MTEDDMLRVVVDRSRWLRGEGSRSSYLIRPFDGKMCCLGFASLAAGDSADSIRGLKVPVVPSALRRIVRPWMSRLAACPSVDVLGDAMIVNDEASLSAEEREDELTRLGESLGIEFVFVDGPEPEVKS